MKKRILSIVLTLCMVLTLCPVTAFAEGETCTVTFDMNGREGNGTSPAPLTVPKGSKIEAPASPSQEEEYDGYNFVYWYVKGSGSRWYFDRDTVQSDLTLLAGWVDYPPVTIKATLDGEPYPGLTVEYRSTSAEGSTYTLTETSAGIYQYNGIKPDTYELFVNNKYYALETVNLGTISYSPSLQFYSVTFDANGQEFTEETAPASKLCWKYDLWYDRSINKPADPVAKDSNYRFIGWTVGPERDSGAFDFVATSISSTTVIYAQWDRIVDENTFPVTAERATIVGSSHAKRGEDYHATLVPAAGYELPFRMTSHYYEQYYTHIKIGGQILNTANYTLNLDTGELTIPGEYITDRVEIVAVPRQNPYIVHFNANGGTGTQEGEGAKVYTDYKGYDYLYHKNTSGWYKLPSCTLTPPDGKMFSHWTYGLNYTNVINPGDSVMVFGDKTYYAIWKDAPEGTYTVAYNLTGCKFSGSTNASNGSDYTTVITPKGGYAAPITLSSVQVGGKTLDSSEYLTAQDGETGAITLTVPGDKINGNIIITASAERVYTVSFNTDGGTIIPSKTTVKWTDKVLDGVSEPTKKGWKFTGWKCGDVTVNSETTYKDLAVDETVLSIELKARWEDVAAPTGEIRIGTISWTTFADMITFNRFYQDTQTVTITASDNNGEPVTVSYLLSDKELTVNELSAKEFTVYKDGFTVEPNNEWIIYAKLTDQAGNAAYLNSTGIVLDNVAPVISGIENGKTYCEAQTVTVDEKYLDSVTVNGKKVSLDENGKFILNPAEGTQTIAATDKAGNASAEITVTVNDRHTAGNDDGDCSTPVYCIYHPKVIVIAAKSHDFSGDWYNDATGHWHVCQNSGCKVSETKEAHSGTDDGDCTTAVICKCGYTITAAKSHDFSG